jgi:hypothetical protein
MARKMGYDTTGLVHCGLMKFWKTAPLIYLFFHQLFLSATSYSNFNFSIRRGRPSRITGDSKFKVWWTRQFQPYWRHVNELKTPKIRDEIDFYDFGVVYYGQRQVVGTDDTCPYWNVKLKLAVIQQGGGSAIWNYDTAQVPIIVSCKISPTPRARRFGWLVDCWPWLLFNCGTVEQMLSVFTSIHRSVKETSSRGGLASLQESGYLLEHHSSPDRFDERSRSD